MQWRGDALGCSAGLAAWSACTPTDQPTECILKIQPAPSCKLERIDETHCTATTYPFRGCLIGCNQVHNVHSDGRNKGVIAEGRCLMQFFDNSGLSHESQLRALLNHAVGNAMLQAMHRDRTKPFSFTSLHSLVPQWATGQNETSASHADMLARRKPFIGRSGVDCPRHASPPSKALLTPAKSLARRFSLGAGSPSSLQCDAFAASSRPKRSW